MTALVALVIGALVGVMGTVAHRQWQLLLDARSGEVAPFGLAIALLLVLAAVTGLRLVFGSRIVALGALIGALGATTLFAQPSSGGSVLVQGDWLGYCWLGGQLLLGIVPVLWPSGRRWTVSSASDAPLEPH